MEEMLNTPEISKEDLIAQKLELILSLGEQATSIEKKMNTLSLELSELGTSVEEELIKKEINNE